MPRAPAHLVQMETVARHAPGERRPQGRDTAFEIGPRPEDGVAVDGDAGIPRRQMLARGGRQHGLVADAGVREQQAHRLERPDDPPLALRGVGRLAQPRAGAGIDPAGIGGRRHPHAPMFFRRSRQRLEEPHPRLAHGFAVRHHVGLGDLDEIGGVEETADGDLAREGDAARFAVGAVEHLAFEG